MIRILNEHGVRFVVIGGIATGVQGAIWATTDLDITYARGRVDHKRLASALTALEAQRYLTANRDLVIAEERTRIEAHSVVVLVPDPYVTNGRTRRTRTLSSVSNLPGNFT